MTQALEPLRRLTSKWVVVVGDRREMLQRAIDIRHQGYRLAHVGGGETPRGSKSHPDHDCRDAISMLADIHFCANEFARDNLIDLGIKRDVHITGLPGLDDLVGLPALPRQDFDLVLINPHPWERVQTEQWLSLAKAAQGTNQGVHVRGSDYGGTSGKRYELDDFIHLLRTCGRFISNSSAIRIEAPMFGTPCIEIGDRQQGRAPAGTGWHHPKGEAVKTIVKIMEAA